MSRKIVFTKSRTDKDAVVIDGYTYNLAKSNKSSKRFRCRYNLTCSASVTVANDETIADRIIRISEIHDHEPTTDDISLKIKEYVAEMKTLAEIEDKPLQEIYEDALLQFKADVGDDEEKILIFPEFEQLKSSLYSHQKKKYPVLPQTCDEIDLKEEFTKTTDEKSFLISDPNDVAKCLIFASENGLKLLNECKTYGSDGTFYASPKLYAQNHLYLHLCH